jgi:uncharacterized protein (TIGR02246 family)
VAATSEDREEIRDLFARYCLYFDRGAAADWAALYTEDGEFVGAGLHLRGRPALEGYLSGIRSGRLHRFTANHVIEVDGDRALCHSSVLLVGAGRIASSGRTVDELRKVDGKWLIARRRYQADPSG